MQAGITYIRRRLGAALAMAPLALLCGEVFTRVMLDQDVDSRLDIYAADEIVGFTYEPHASAYETGREYRVPYRISSLGFRDREYAPKTAGVFRVMLVGDSFSVGHGLTVSESFPKQLERALQAEADGADLRMRIEVVNAANGGYSPYNYWKAYHRWKGALAPDLVLVGFSPDDTDCSNAGVTYVIDGGEIVELRRPGDERTTAARHASALTRARKWLARNSELYVLLRNFLYYNDMVGRSTQRRKAKAHPRLIRPYVRPESIRMADAWRTSLGFIRELHADTRADGVPLVVVSIPLKLEIDPARREQVMKAHGLTRGEVDVSQPLRRLSAFCCELRIPLLDPRETIRERHSVTRCYFRYDGHWNADGVRAGADACATKWRDLHLPPFGSARNGEAAVLPEGALDIATGTCAE